MKMESGNRSRDIRALAWLAVALILAGAYQFWPAGSGSAGASVSADEVALAEQRLERLREVTASVPAKRNVLEQVSAELAEREAGLIAAETGAQAQATMIQLLRQVGTEEAPGVQITATQLGRLQPLGDDYGAASVTIRMECHIEQLINFLAGVAALEQLIATENMNIVSSDDAGKMLNVELTFTGAVPGSLLPRQEEAGA